MMEGATNRASFSLLQETGQITSLSIQKLPFQLGICPPKVGGILRCSAVLLQCRLMGMGPPSLFLKQFTQRTQLFFPGSQLLSSRFQKSFPLFQTLQLRQFLPESSLLSLSIASVLHSLCLPRCPFLHLIEYGIPLFFQVFQ